MNATVPSAATSVRSAGVAVAIRATRHARPWWLLALPALLLLTLLPQVVRAEGGDGEGAGAGDEASSGDSSLPLGSTAGNLAATDTPDSRGVPLRWHTFDGEAGQRVRFELISEAFDAYLVVVTPNGKRFEDDDGAFGTNSRLDLTLPETGRYRIGASAYSGGSSGPYTLRVFRIVDENATPRDEPLAAGHVYTARLHDGLPQRDDGPYVATFVLDATAGERLVLALDSDEFDAYLTVTTPSGEHWTNDDGGTGTNSLLEITVSETGRYQIGASSYSAGETGTFWLVVERKQVPPGRAAALGETPGELTDESDRHGNRPVNWYEYAAEAAERLTVTLRSGTFDTYLIVMLPSGETLENDDYDGTNSFLEFEVPARGTVRIGASAFSSSNIGAYTLVLTSSRGSGSTDMAEDAAGRDEYGQIQPGEFTAVLARPVSPAGQPEQGRPIDWYVYMGQAGQTLSIALGSEVFNTYLYVELPSGEMLENDDHDGTNSFLMVELATDGPVRIGASAYDVAADTFGAYRLRLDVERGDDEAAGRTVEAGEFHGTLTAESTRHSSGRPVDWYRYEGRAGESLAITLASGELDTYLYVELPDGETRENDDHDGTNSYLEVTLPAAGPVRIGASAFGQAETGAYMLRIVSDAAEAGPSILPIEPGTHNGSLVHGDGTLDSGEYIDWFSFDGQPGDVVVFDVRSSEFDTYLFVHTADEQTHENDDAESGTTNSRLELVLQHEGMYYVGVTSYEPGETGAYTLVFTRERGGSATQQPVIVINAESETSGGLAAGDYRLVAGEFADRYDLNLPAGAAVVIEMVAEDSAVLDCYLIVGTPEGQQRENDDAEPGTLNARLTLTAVTAGVYRIYATSYEAGMTGAYTLTVRPAGDAAEAGRPGRVRGREGASYYGIFCGVSNYGGRGDLAYCREDADKLAQAFRANGLMPARNQVVLLDGECTADSMRAAFHRMAGRVGPNDVFVFFFSGHGGKTDEGEFAGELDNRNETIYGSDYSALTDDEMNELLGTLHADALKMVVLDACYSGGFARDVISARNRVGFFSSEADLTSQVAGEFEAGGYLSLFFRQAVSGPADLNGNGVITVGEVKDFLLDQYARHARAEGNTEDGASSRQTLVYDRGTVSPDVPLVRAER